MNNDLISREALTEEMRKSINERYPKWDEPPFWYEDEEGEEGDEEDDDA